MKLAAAILFFLAGFAIGVAFWPWGILPEIVLCAISGVLFAFWLDERYW